MAIFDDRFFPFLIFPNQGRAAIINAIWNNLEKKGELFMLEFLQTGKALSVLAAIGIIGIVSKLITRSLYKRLLKETDNMANDQEQEFKGTKAEIGKMRIV